MFRGLLIAACVLGGATAAFADEAPAIATYAIVVGSNAGGPGQIDLHYAEDDARRVAAVLTELGGYAPAQVEVIVHPTPDQLREQLVKLEDRVQADVAAGRQARVFFYYSGHARAQAIDLGGAELPLVELRERLFKVPATLTVVVLDACQSGAFSRIKGAAPAADFSYSSRQHLDAAGIAVLASSSGSELSQESEQLRGSYFTHNLLVGLRGAGDANNDGQVTIDEAYRYAYNQTLLETAETAVGGQHVTFEADLKGHGDVPLSFPRAASAAIVLPGPMQGKAFVSDHRARAVVAEIQKAKGAPVRIAVAPGEYDVVVTDGDVVAECQVVAPGEVDLDRCTRKLVTKNSIKGGGFARPLRIELGIASGPDRSDGYTTNLENFQYVSSDDSDTTGQVTVLRQIAPYVFVGGSIAYTSLPEWTHLITGASPLQQKLDWNTTTVSAVGRIAYPLSTHWLAYVQGELGGGIGRSDLTDTDGKKYPETSFGVALAGGGGVGYETWFGVGILFGAEYVFQPIIKDLIGNTHDDGGGRVTSALTFSF